MDDDSLDPRHRLADPRPLGSFSIDELQTYQQELRAELERVRTALETKQAEINSAHAIFKL